MTTDKVQAFLGVTEDEAASMTEIATKLQEKINAKRVEEEFKHFKELLKRIPADLQPLTVLVFDGVWGEL